MGFKGDLEALILGVLEAGEAHGYEISKRIRQLSSEALEVGESQLYPALHSLEQEEFVEAHWIPQAGKPSRKVYRLTAKGITGLARKRQDWSRFARGVAAVLSTRNPAVG